MPNKPQVHKRKTHLYFCFIIVLPVFVKGKATETNIFNYLKTQEEANGNQYVTESGNCRVQIREVKGQ